MRGPILFIVAVLLSVTLAGCLDPGEPVDDPGGLEARSIAVNVTDTADEPIALAQVVALAGETPRLIASTDKNGTATLHLPEAVDGLWVSASGHMAMSFTAPFQDSLNVRLGTGADDANLSSLPGLRFNEAVDLGSQTYPLAVGTACMEPEDQPNQDCGLGEPTIEVDADGTIYLSGVCCIGSAPPVLVSRDDGETFQTLETPGVREAFGIEGDFAIDDDGVIYFVDIELAATFQITAWDKDGEFLHHTKWPAPPLVDRPWLRADGSGGLYYVYNTGSSTNVYTSDDGGRIWSPTAVHELPYALGNAVSGNADGELWVLGSGRADYTKDGGESWETEDTPVPSGGAQSVSAGFFDEAGNLFVTEDDGDEITVTKRDSNGTWQEPVVVSPPEGHHRFSWIAAGAEGTAAVAWYGTLDEDITQDSEWFLFVAASVDAHRDDAHWAVSIADPEPVLHGDLQRQLLDFLQVEIGPDDAVHVGYSKLRPGEGTEEQLHYVQSNRMLPLSAMDYPWGPKE